MDIAFLSNHVSPFHVGGSESVIKNVSEHLFSIGHKVSVYGCDAKDSLIINGVKIDKCNSLNIGHILNSHEKIIVYSDSFLLLPQVLKLQKIINKKIILFPVGMNACISNSSLRSLLLSNREIINFICHDESYNDAKFLNENKIKFKVIPNGINEKEFSFKNRKFVKKEYLDIACVANTFPKKGHLELLKVCEILNKKVPIELNICCSTPSWNVALKLQNNLNNYSRNLNFPVKWHINYPREKIIDILISANVFAFCSLKEVAPICILESCASGLPWVSFNVGNVKKIPGGRVVDVPSMDMHGCISPGNIDFANHANAILEICENSLIWDEKSEDGIKFAKSITWSEIVKLYEQYI